MPPFNIYKKHLGSFTDGGARKNESDLIMEATWNEDIQSKVAYFYDHYLDDEPLGFLNLHPEISKTKIPIEVKFMTNSHNSDSKDQVSYKIMFKPSFQWENVRMLDFYQKRFVEKLQSEFPIGLWVDLPDEKGKYRHLLYTYLGLS